MSLAVDVVVLVSGDSSLELDVLGGGYAPIGAETTVSVAASMPDGTPVEFLVAGPDGNAAAQTTATVTAGTASISFTPAAVGVHEVTATTSAPDRSAVGFVTALDPSANIGQATAFGRIDSNGDGLYEQLTVDVPVAVDVDRDVRVVARLVGPDGAVLFGGVIRTLVPAGGATVTLPFDANLLYDLGLGGPFTVESAILIDHATEHVLAWSDSVGASPAWDSALWQHDRVSIGESFTDQGVDTDGDGDFDRLEVTGEVTVDTAATYAVNARVVSHDGVEIVDFQSEIALPAGRSPLVLSFDGAALGSSGIDGPYDVEDLSVYPVLNTDALGYRVTVHTTDVYNACQFQGGPPCTVADPTGLWAACVEYHNLEPTPRYRVDAGWDAAAGAASYKLYRQNIGNSGRPTNDAPIVVWTGTGTLAYDKDVTKDKTYDYWVTAIGNDGVETGPSNVRRVTIDCYGTTEM